MLAVRLVFHSVAIHGGALEISPASHDKRPQSFESRSKFQKRNQLFIRMYNERFPSSRCASTIQIVRPLPSSAEPQPTLNPALIILSAMISQYPFHAPDSVSFALHTAMIFSRCASRLPT